MPTRSRIDGFWFTTPSPGCILGGTCAWTVATAEASRKLIAANFRIVLLLNMILQLNLSYFFVAAGAGTSGTAAGSVGGTYGPLTGGSPCLAIKSMALSIEMWMFPCASLPALDR